MLRYFFKLYINRMRILFIIAMLYAFNGFSQYSTSLSPERTLINQANELFEKQNLSAARGVYANYISTYPAGDFIAEATYNEAFCALLLYHKDGELLIKRFIENYPEHPKAGLAYFELGSYYYKSRNYTKSVEFLSKADFTRISGETKEEGLFRLAYSYFMLKKFTDAQPYFNQLKTGSGAYGAPASYYSGYILYEQKQYAQAVQDFDRAEKNSAYQAEVPYMKASALFEMKDYNRLIAYTTVKMESGQKYSNIQTLYLLTAESYFLSNNFQKAEKYYSEYQDLNRGRIENDILYRIGYSQFAMNKFEEAEKSLEKIAGNKDEVGVFASYYLGIIYQKQKNSRYALTAFDQVRNNSFNIELAQQAEYQYGKISFLEDQYSEAISSFERYIQKYPDSENFNEINEMLSEAYLLTNDYQKAIKHIESLKKRSASINKAYQKATFLQGTVYFNKGDYRRAVDLFDKSLQNSIDSEVVIEALYWKSEAFSVGKRYEEAAQGYKRIINEFSSSSSNFIVRANYGLGYCYYNQSDYPKALASFTSFINKDKTAPSKMISDAYVRQADCYYVAKNYDAAISSYEQSLKLNTPDRDYVFLQLGMVNGLKDNQTAADSYFSRVINQGVTSRYYDDALFQRAQLLFNKTEYKEAIGLYSKLITSKPNSQYVPFALLRRASAYYNIKDNNKAVEDYKLIFANHITHPVAKDALIPMQDLLSTVGQSNQYDQYLAQYKKANPEEKGLEGIEFETSKSRYFSQNYRPAIKGLRAFVANYPEDARVEEAQFYIGDSYYRLTKMDSATIWLSKLENTTSFWQYPRVIERLADISMKNKDYKKATFYYKKVEVFTSDKRQQNEARSGLMTAHFMNSAYDSTIYYAQVILRSGSTDVNAENKASLYLGKAYFAKGNYDLAKDEFLSTTNSAKDQYGAEAQYLLGELFYNAKSYNHSIEVLIDLNDKYPTYQDWVGKGFLLIADNYLALNDYFQAKGTLNSLVEYFPDEGLKEQARKKIKAIEEMEASKLQQKNEQDTVGIKLKGGQDEN